MKLIRGGGDALRDEGLEAIVSAMIHNRPEDWARAREIDRTLSRRARLYLVEGAGPPFRHRGPTPRSGRSDATG